MSNSLLHWQQQNDLIDQRIRTFERKFFIVKNPVKEVEPDPKPQPPSEGVVYGRITKTFTRNRLFKRVTEQEAKSDPEKIRESLYPTGRGRK